MGCYLSGTIIQLTGDKFFNNRFVTVHILSIINFKENGFTQEFILRLYLYCVFCYNVHSFFSKKFKKSETDLISESFVMKHLTNTLDGF